MERVPGTMKAPGKAIKYTPIEGHFPLKTMCWTAILSDSGALKGSDPSYRGRKQNGFEPGHIHG